MNIKIAIADDHPVITDGLKSGLTEYDFITVTATYKNGKQLLLGLQADVPDILLLDMQMPDYTGDQLMEIIARKFKSVKVIVVSSNDIVYQVKKMLKLGCKGYLLKDSELETIASAIKTVHEGEEFISPKIQEALMKDLFTANGNTQAPSRREIEVLKEISNGNTTQEIADNLFLSPHTVDKHRTSIMNKLNAKNTAELIKLGMQQGLI